MVDGMSSWWAAVHGYGVPELDRAVADQLSSVAHVMFGGSLTARPSRPASRWWSARRLFGSGLPGGFRICSGRSCAQDGRAVWRGRGRPDKWVVALKGGYGDTLGAMSVSDPATGRHEASAMIPRHFSNVIERAGLLKRLRISRKY